VFKTTDVKAFLEKQKKRQNWSKRLYNNKLKQKSEFSNFCLKEHYSLKTLYGYHVQNVANPKTENLNPGFPGF